MSIDHMLNMGETIDLMERYEFLQSMGQGSYGQVHKCMKISTGEIVALKEIINHNAENTIRVELEMLRAISCLDPDANNLIRFNYAFKSTDGCYFMEFEMLDRTVWDFMGCRNSSFSLSEIRPMAKGLMVALKALADVGVIHSDLKPDNVMLVDFERHPFKVKLIDFGVAMFQRPGDIMDWLQPTPYRAPEVTLGLPITAAIDMWSLGCCLLEWYLQFYPFNANSPYDSLRQITHLLGVPDGNLIRQSKEGKSFFVQGETGEWRLKTLSEYRDPEGNIPQLGQNYLEAATGLEDVVLNFYEIESGMEYEDRRAFLDLLKKMLELDPEKRITPPEALKHKFITMTHFKSALRYVMKSGKIAEFTPSQAHAPNIPIRQQRFMVMNSPPRNEASLRVSVQPAPSSMIREGLASQPAPSSNTREGLPSQPAPSSNTREGLASQPAPSSNTRESLASQPAPSSNTREGQASQPAPSSNIREGLASQPASSSNTREGLASQPAPSSNTREGLASQPAPSSNIREGSASQSEFQTLSQCVPDAHCSDCGHVQQQAVNAAGPQKGYNIHLSSRSIAIGGNDRSGSPPKTTSPDLYTCDEESSSRPCSAVGGLELSQDVIEPLDIAPAAVGLLQLDSSWEMQQGLNGISVASLDSTDNGTTDDEDKVLTSPENVLRVEESSSKEGSIDLKPVLSGKSTIERISKSNGVTSTGMVSVSLSNEPLSSQHEHRVPIQSMLTRREHIQIVRNSFDNNWEETKINQPISNQPQMVDVTLHQTPSLPENNEVDLSPNSPFCFSLVRPVLNFCSSFFSFRVSNH